MKSMVKKTGYFNFFSILHTVKYEARPVQDQYTIVVLQDQ